MLNHKTTYRVRYADTDKMGFAHHANYFRWFEVGRSELFRQIGLPYKEIEARGVYLPLSAIHCEFKSPAQYDDLLVIKTDLDESLKATIQFNYQIYSEDENTLVAEGFTKHACMDSNGRVVRPPDFLVDIIRKNA
jgi:acyl-CoA thioester hydrolase